MGIEMSIDPDQAQWPAERTAHACPGARRYGMIATNYSEQIRLLRQCFYPSGKLPVEMGNGSKCCAIRRIANPDNAFPIQATTRTRPE